MGFQKNGQTLPELSCLHLDFWRSAEMICTGTSGFRLLSYFRLVFFFLCHHSRFCSAMKERPKKTTFQLQSDKLSWPLLAKTIQAQCNLQLPSFCLGFACAWPFSGPFSCGRQERIPYFLGKDEMMKYVYTVYVYPRKEDKQGPQSKVPQIQIEPCGRKWQSRVCFNLGGRGRESQVTTTRTIVEACVHPWPSFPLSPSWPPPEGDRWHT